MRKAATCGWRRSIFRMARVNSAKTRWCRWPIPWPDTCSRSEEHTSELQSLRHLVCRLLLEKKEKRHEYFQDALRCGNLAHRVQKNRRALEQHELFFFKTKGAPGDPPSSPTEPSPE